MPDRAVRSADSSFSEFCDRVDGLKSASLQALLGQVACQHSSTGAAV
jgi:hypothetical protein